MDQQKIIKDIARRAKGSRISIAGLCRRAGIHPDTFHNWKQTERNPNPPGAKEWKLVVGMHRHGGCALEGINVLALEVSGNAEDMADLEASENLHRRPLGPIERAKFTAALVQAAQERIAREHGDLDQYQRGAKARWDRVKHHEETVEGALRDETEGACATMAQAYG